jgi:hypothetical protein
MDKQKQKQLKVFGYGLPLMLAFFGLRHGFKHSWDVLSFCLLSLAVIVLAITIFNRPLLIKIFEIWMKVMGIIGSVVTAVILSIVYYLIFSLISVILKIRGKDFMASSLNKEIKTYWTPKEHLGSKDKEQYTKQF